MDDQILYLTLATLAFAIALNLKLTLSVLEAARREREPAEVLMPGHRVPNVTARSARGRVELAPNNQVAVLMFLSSKCVKCRSKLPEIEKMMPAARDAGLALWVVSAEPAWRMRQFLHGSDVGTIIAQVKRKDYKVLNGKMVSPAYLFVNHESMLEAAGLIGDADWLALREQLGAHAPLEQAA